MLLPGVDDGVDARGGLSKGQVGQVGARGSGLALPRTVIDPPDSPGKLDVAEGVAARGRRPVPSAPAPPTRS